MFADERRIVVEDLVHSKGERRYYCLGQVGKGILTVRFTLRAGTIRIIGAGFWRRGKLATPMSRCRSAASQVLGLLPVEVEPHPDAAALKRTVVLARRCDLSVYDATYIDLARQRALPLATLDGRLRTACAAQRIAVLP